MNQFNFDNLAKQLAGAGQAHLADVYQGLTDGQAKEAFLSQLQTLDLREFKKLTQTLNQPPVESGNKHIEPLEPVDVKNLSDDDREKWRKSGIDLIKAGKVACFLAAGGQGTRLGHDGPKGTFDLGLASGKSLFELQAQRIRDLEAGSGNSIPWYIMTSPQNHQESTGFFEQHDYFGLNRDNVIFFTQGTLPLVDAEGRILLATESSLAVGPDGNGGCFKALEKSGALGDMHKRGIEYVFFHNIDNVLVNMADPLFIGLTAGKGHPVGSKVVAKTNPDEKVGLLLKNQGKPSVLEYSDLSPALLQMKNDRGELMYNNGSIAIHVFTLDFLLKNATSPLPLHPAHKKVPTRDNPNPAEPNAYKFEMFMFDIFPLADNVTALRVNREEEFAPVKNKQGIDSPESARSLLLNHYKKTGDAGLI